MRTRLTQSPFSISIPCIWHGSRHSTRHAKVASKTPNYSTQQNVCDDDYTCDTILCVHGQTADAQKCSTNPTTGPEVLVGRITNGTCVESEHAFLIPYVMEWGLKAATTSQLHSRSPECQISPGTSANATIVDNSNSVSGTLNA